VTITIDGTRIDSLNINRFRDENFIVIVASYLLYFFHYHSLHILHGRMAVGGGTSWVFPRPEPVLDHFRLVPEQDKGPFEGEVNGVGVQQDPNQSLEGPKA
jgi:hypothetical protein